MLMVTPQYANAKPLGVTDAKPIPGYTLIQERPLWGVRVRLWRNDDNGFKHGQIDFVPAPGGSVWLQGPGCPGGGTCNHTNVPNGSTMANTVPRLGTLDACGQWYEPKLGGWASLCTCINCLAEPETEHSGDALAPPAAIGAELAQKRPDMKVKAGSGTREAEVSQGSLQSTGYFI
jgi:hypothetical protein